MLGNPASLVTTTSASANFFSCSLLVPNKAHKTQQHPLLSYISTPSFTLKGRTFLSSRHHNSKLTHFTSHSLSHHKCTPTLTVHGLDKGQRGGSSVMEMSDLDGEEEVEDGHNVFNGLDEEYVEDGGGDDDEEDVVLPFAKMKEWLQKKPCGFGEGKAYDTSVEDKLLEEIEHSRQAQAVNVSNLRANPVPPKKDQKKKRASEAVPSGIAVRLSNLPKKKNIHRDLKSAFKDVRGIVDISPAVSGNKKTKDPVCKGFAFVYFKTEDDADRFVQLFSSQSVAFGKNEKQIKCEMINRNSSNTSNSESTSSFFSDPQSVAPTMEGNLNADSEIDDSFVEESAFDISDGSDIELTATSLGASENVDSLGVSELKYYDKPKIEPATSSSSFRKQQKQRAPKKNTSAKGEQKVPKLNVPGSSKRLKMKEKAVLTDVFSKYGLKSALATGEER